MEEREDEEQDTTALGEDLRLGTRVPQKPWFLVVAGRQRVGTLIEVRHKMTIGRAPPAEVVLD
ncbi:MAG TPA: hypothetical protein VM925_03715, partial [Labilithrix sp.]|nr:hypothetical protein [Labilithrix sp.]